MEIMELVLFLCADMEDGLGLLISARPHGKTAAQLFTRLRCADAWLPAAECGHVEVIIKTIIEPEGF